MKQLFGSNQLYSLRKSKETLLHVYRQYRKKKKKLAASVQSQMESALKSLEQEIQNQDREKADNCAKQVESLAKIHLRKSSFEHFKDLVFALAFALIVAVIVRQMWFEFYEIPSGSMRPTFKEQDRLVVSKTDFGINLPLTPDHLYFDPHLVKRSGVVIFTGENMDIRDVDTLYFYLFPGKKQYIKRLIGKPGDTLYFYGGKIYGIDQDGHDITPMLQLPQLSKIDHIPFISFEGKVSTPHSPIQGVYSPVVLHQMNEPIARLYLSGQNQVQGEMLNLSQTHDPRFPPVSDYSELWGFKNYAMARLLTKEQVKQFTDQLVSEMEEGVLYLELKHHPSLSSAKLIRDEWGRLRPALKVSTTIIPLKEQHLQTIFSNLYTARFIVKNGFARRFGTELKTAGKNSFLPHLPEVPDGCYEFYYGKAYEVKWQGIIEELSPNHPLYRFSPARLQMLFNVGIEFDTRFAPQAKNQTLNPARYSYFRDGDLYLLGAPILKKEDPTLIAFEEREQKRQASANPQYPYTPFQDYGPPFLENGALDFTRLKQYGLVIPQHMYLVLGDNHAMSADSRDFGFVPQQNLRGGPSFIFWPPGDRFGAPNQPPYPWINLPNTLMWGAAILIIGGWYIVHRKRCRLPLDFS